MIRLLSFCTTLILLCQALIAPAQGSGTIIFTNDNTPNKNIGIYCSDKYLSDDPPYTFVQPGAVKKFAAEGSMLFYTTRKPVQVLLALPGDSFLVRKGKAGRLNFVLLNNPARKNDAQAMDRLIDSLGQFIDAEAIDRILPVTYRFGVDTLGPAQMRRANNNAQRDSLLYSYLLQRLAFVERLHQDGQVSDVFATFFKDYFRFNYLTKSIWGFVYESAPLDSFPLFAKTLAATNFLNKPDLLQIDAYRGFMPRYINYLRYKKYKTSNTPYSNLLAIQEQAMDPTVKNWLLLVTTEKAFASGSVPDSLLQYFYAHCTDSGYRKRVADKLAFANQAAQAGGSQALVNRYGQVINFAYLLKAKKDSVVVIDFWATWCKPCLEEAPYFASLKKMMGGQKVSFIAISLDKDRAKWLDFFRQHVGNVKRDDFLLLNDFASPLAKRFQIASIPRVVVLKGSKVIALEAPPPSNPKLKKLIEQYISQ